MNIEHTLFPTIEEAVKNAKKEFLSNCEDGERPDDLSIQVYDDFDGRWYAASFSIDSDMTSWGRGKEVIHAFETLEVDLSPWDEDWTVQL